jgi:hypothetical protein
MRSCGPQDWNWRRADDKAKKGETLRQKKAPTCRGTGALVVRSCDLIRRRRRDAYALSPRPADEIEKLDRLKKAGSISDTEFARLRAELVQ